MESFKIDPEIDAMSGILRVLQPLEDEQRARVLQWAAQRYSIAANTVNSSVSHVMSVAQPEVGNQESADESAQDDAYSYFAELFDAARPKQGTEKVLVGAYWFQVVKGAPTFRSREVNQELKNVGYGVTSINKLFKSLQIRKPSLIMQVSKTSSSAQAKKTYKLTIEGIRAVEQMVAQGKA